MDVLASLVTFTSINLPQSSADRKLFAQHKSAAARERNVNLIAA